MQDAHWDERLDSAEKPGRLIDLMKSCMTVVEGCLALQSGDSVLILTDTEVSPMLSQAMAAAVHCRGGIPTTLLMRPVPHANAEPPAVVAAAMREADITIAMVSRTITHTLARESATQQHKRRYLLMPSVTEDSMMRGAATADFQVVKEITMTTASLLRDRKRVHVTSPEGTDLTFSMEGRPFRAYFGECIKPGAVELFPGGELNTLPVEESVKGTVVFDHFFTEVGLLREPITIQFEQGRAVSIRGGQEAERLKRILANTKSEDSYRLGEFAIGTNYRARFVGSTFEDKESYGTVHMALGSGVAWPKYYKPSYHAPIHLDGVLSCPTVEVDGELIVKDRRILVAPQPPEG